jgi:hypothetical protein
VPRARSSLTRLLAATIWVLPCAPTWSQDYLDAPPPEVTPLWNADSTSLDGCQIIARIDNQIVLACEVQWLVNSIIEQNQDKIPPSEIPALREQLLKREIASLLDHKLIYGEFLRNVPAERLPDIAEDLLQPFQEHEAPKLMEQLKVKDQRSLEQELATSGPSPANGSEPK